MRRIVSFGPAFVVLLCVALVLVVAPQAVRRLNAEQTRATVRLAQQATDSDDILERLNRAVRAVATATEPSVVHLAVVGELSRDEPFRSASGSGWVYDEQGNLVTNAHVVAGAKTILAQFSDGRVLHASLVGLDPATDVAVIHVDPDVPLIPIRRATGERVAKGDRVFAFGSPFEFKFSMSEGIVSGLGRTARTAMGFAGFSNFIQTDAAVNPGNSGGPLVDIHGRLVGMNVAIATAENTKGSSQGQSAGISFAIPLGIIEDRVPQIIAGGPIESGYLGISFAGQEGVPTGAGQPPGVRVGRVASGGPAEKAGMVTDDIISAIDGQSVTSSEVLRALVASTKPGTSVNLKVFRDGEPLDLQVVLQAMPSEVIDDQYLRTLREEFKVVLGTEGDAVVVAFVVPGSYASAAGLAAGQQVVTVNDVAVTTPAEAARRLISSGLLTGRTVHVKVIIPSADDKTPRNIELRSE
ncbi:MAG: trypsin-like peptidase domain-containing protein [Phycisphaerales bacterium]|jgi:S1-C subfamily serine protease